MCTYTTSIKEKGIEEGIARNIKTLLKKEKRQKR